MSVLRSVTSIRSPWVAVIGGPGTRPLYVHAWISRPDGSRTVAVCAVRTYFRVVPPGAGVPGPRRSVTDTPGPKLDDRPGPPLVSTDPPGMNNRPTPVVPALATTAPPAKPTNPRRESPGVPCRACAGAMSASPGVSTGAATTRAVSSAPAPTAEVAINAVLQARGEPA